MSVSIPPLEEYRRAVAEALIRARINVRDGLEVLGPMLEHRRPDRRPRTPREIASMWREFLRDAPRENPLRLYANVPFCQQRCTFCKFNIRTIDSPEQVDRYADQLMREIEFYAELFSGFRFDYYAVGGGTPSVLSEGQIARLFGRVAELYSFTPDALKTIELNPASASQGKLRAIRAAGFNRVSIGVQSLSTEVLARVDREYQDFARVRDVVSWARAAGLEQVNTSLVLGLVGDGLPSFFKTVETLAELRPSSISVNRLNLTQAYMQREGLEPERYAAAQATLIERALSGLRDICRRRGYRDHDLKPGKGIWYLYNDDVPAELMEDFERDHPEAGNNSLIGLGDFSLSHVFRRGFYERIPGEFDPEKPLYRFSPFDLENERARYVHCMLRTRSGIDLAEYRRHFGEEFEDAYGFELKVGEALGTLAVERGRVAFLPKERTERLFYASLLLFRHLPLNAPGVAAARRKLSRRLEAGSPT